MKMEYFEELQRLARLIPPACKRIWATERKKMKKVESIKRRNNKEEIQKLWSPQMIKIRRIVAIIKKIR